MVRLEVSSSTAMASAVSGFRVRRSTWMIWNSRSARLMGRPFCLWLEGRHPMLTACWQQGASIPGQHSNQEDFVHVDSVRPGPLDNDVAAADTTVAAGDG